MSNHGVTCAQQFHGADQSNFARANALPDLELAHIERELLRDIIRKALDLDFTRYNLEQAALQLHALRIALGDDGNLDMDSSGEIDSFQIDMEQIVLDWIVLPVDDHHRQRFVLRQGQVKNRIVASLAVQDPGEIF